MSKEPDIHVYMSEADLFHYQPDSVNVLSTFVESLAKQIANTIVKKENSNLLHSIQGFNKPISQPIQVIPVGNIKLRLLPSEKTTLSVELPNTSLMKIVIHKSAKINPEGGDAFFIVIQVNNIENGIVELYNMRVDENFRLLDYQGKIQDTLDLSSAFSQSCLCILYILTFLLEFNSQPDNFINPPTRFIHGRKLPKNHLKRKYYTLSLRPRQVVELPGIPMESGITQQPHLRASHYRRYKSGKVIVVKAHKIHKDKFIEGVHDQPKHLRY